MKLKNEKDYLKDLKWSRSQSWYPRYKDAIEKEIKRVEKKLSIINGGSLK